MTERDYGKEYRDFHGTKEQKMRRAERGRARYKAEKEGRVNEGDGKEVDHLGSHRTGSLENVPTRVVSRETNRKRQPKRT